MAAQSQLVIPTKIDGAAPKCGWALGQTTYLATRQACAGRIAQPRAQRRVCRIHWAQLKSGEQDGLAHLSLAGHPPPSVKTHMQGQPRAGLLQAKIATDDKDHGIIDQYVSK